MKNLLLVLFLSIVGFAQADQLAYLTKEQAEEVAAYLNKKNEIYLFCGCCAIVEPQRIIVDHAEAVYTGYEDYWEVEIAYEYTDEKTYFKRKKLDLAYVWKKGLFGYKTLGKKFKLDHDPCVNIKDWDNPANVEEDI